jgi:hypothetical protein
VTPTELRDEFQRRYRAKQIFTRVRIYAGDDTKDTACPGANAGRKWTFLAARIFAIAPNWHRLELLDAGKAIVGAPIERQLGDAIGLPTDLGDLAEEVAVTAGPNAGQQLASFGGLLQLVIAAVRELRKGDREILESVSKTATNTMQLYAGRVEMMEKNLQRQIDLEYALARKAGRIAASAGGEGSEGGGGHSMSDDALMELAQGFMEWMRGGQPKPPNGANGNGAPDGH